MNKPGPRTRSSSKRLLNETPTSSRSHKLYDLDSRDRSHDRNNISQQFSNLRALHENTSNLSRTNSFNSRQSSDFNYSPNNLNNHNSNFYSASSSNNFHTRRDRNLSSTFLNTRTTGFFDPFTYLDRDKYLKRDQLKRLEHHNYQTEGTTILEPYLKKSCTYLIKIFPSWCSPNLIILISLILQVIFSLLIFIECPTADSFSKSANQSGNNSHISQREKYRRQLFIFNIFSLLVYQIFTTLDLIQAKKLNLQKSHLNLTILFNHGMSAVVTILNTNNILIALGGGTEPLLMFVICILSFMGFYISHWSSYITGKLHFSAFDVIEMQWSCMLVYLLSYLYGQDIWSWSFFGISYVKGKF